MKKTVFLIVFMISSFTIFAQAEWIVGQWRTVDDETGETKGIVEFYKDADSYYGKIVKVFYKGEELKNTGFEDMVVIKEMKEDEGILNGGKIYDPEKKKTYYGKIYHNDNNTITLRGSLDKRGWIGRSQTWIR